MCINRMKDDFAYLRHIRDAIAKIEEYVVDIRYEDFMTRSLVQDGVIRQIEIIGEATKMLSIDFKEKYSDIPWTDIAGMRDKLIQGYLNVDLNAVWDTVEKDIPPLKEFIKKVLDERS